MSTSSWTVLLLLRPADATTGLDSSLTPMVSHRAGFPSVRSNTSTGKSSRTPPSTHVTFSAGYSTPSTVAARALSGNDQGILLRVGQVGVRFGVVYTQLRELGYADLLQLPAQPFTEVGATVVQPLLDDKPLGKLHIAQRGAIREARVIDRLHDLGDTGEWLPRRVQGCDKRSDNGPSAGTGHPAGRACRRAMPDLMRSSRTGLIPPEARRDSESARSSPARIPDGLVVGNRRHLSFCPVAVMVFDSATIRGG